MYLTNETTLDVGIFAAPQSGWRDSTQEEIDAFDLQAAKDAKSKELQSDFCDFECLGFSYSGNTFDLDKDSIANIVDVKTEVDPANPDRYKFANTSGVFIDFADQAGWDAFKQAICTERDRIMVYYVSKKKEINDCLTVAAVEAVTIDFSPT
jgi:hypothetical protein